jgi:hypothetical protein
VVLHIKGFSQEKHLSLHKSTNGGSKMLQSFKSNPSINSAGGAVRRGSCSPCLHSCRRNWWLRLPEHRSRVGTDIYKSIGATLINARGTFTISGSNAARSPRGQSAASQQYVQLDDLMDAIGARLAELTKAEWVTVSSGCAAG